MRKPFPPELDDVTRTGLIFRCFVCLVAFVVMCLGIVLFSPIGLVIWLYKQAKEV